jgi:ATP-dependent helicase/nuclease subunit B
MTGTDIIPATEGSKTLAGRVFKCPAHVPFLPSLASAISNGAIWDGERPQPHELAGIVIYVPSLGAVEPLKLAFLAQSPNGATFLPRIRVLGDADPADLFALYGTRMDSTADAITLFEEALAIPEAYGDLERQAELAAFVMQASQSLKGGQFGIDVPFLRISPASAFKIAGQLTALIGEVHSEGASQVPPHSVSLPEGREDAVRSAAAAPSPLGERVGVRGSFQFPERTIQAYPLSRISIIAGGNGSGAEQLSLQLLRAVFGAWEAHKKRSAKLDREERRNRLMAVEAEFIRRSTTPVIVAGSTGSIGATAGLMEAALDRPRSALVLHGLDDFCGETWDTLGAHPEHAQHGLHHLLTRLELKPADVHPLQSPPGVAVHQALPARARFLSEAMKPAPATAGWASSIERLKSEEACPASGLSLIETETLQEEASIIALMLRESLETPGQTAALVTPSDALLSRVTHALAQWGLSADARERQDADDFAARALACAASNKPEDFIALMRSCGGKAGHRIRRSAEIADLGVLRQMWRPRSLDEIPSALARAEHAISSGEARHPALKRIAGVEWEAARTLAIEAIEALQPLRRLAGKARPLPVWTEAHAEALSRLAKLALAVGFGQQTGTLARLHESAPKSLALDLADYNELFAEAALMQKAPEAQPPHPRLYLWKPLDARLMTVDFLILGGLNEGCWPQAPGPDPWLGRKDRASCGLPPQERRIGQAAHDFMTLAASAPRVVLTRSRKVNGTAARPSRWISRIKALARGIGIEDALKPERPFQSWASALAMPARVQPAAKPQPRPPLAARPRKLSVTAIESWFANPYAIYAKHILRLDPLRGLHETADARDKGILYHAALHGFFQAFPEEIPENAAAKLVQKLDRAAEELGFNLENAPFWRPRFARFAEWFASTEAARREGVVTLKSEASGKLRVDAPAGPFEIRARADRIDRLDDGSLRIYDFKTSANTAKVSAGRGAPQLALEGFLAREGAFAGVPAGAAAELFYIVASGGEPPGETVSLKMPSAEAIQAAFSGTVLRIERFDDEATPYTYETRAIFRDKSENDPYAHLARVQEWAGGAANGDADDE